MMSLHLPSVILFMLLFGKLNCVGYVVAAPSFLEVMYCSYWMF